MELKDLAPWIAIAITLILSILVPLFTQIANNQFQLKLEQQRAERDEKEKALIRKRDAFEYFILSVGGCLGAPSESLQQDAIASIGKLYIYTPKEWWEMLDGLYKHMFNGEWESAATYFRELSKSIAKEIEK